MHLSFVLVTVGTRPGARELALRPSAQMTVFDSDGPRTCGNSGQVLVVVGHRVIPPPATVSHRSWKVDASIAIYTPQLIALAVACYPKSPALRWARGTDRFGRTLHGA